MPLKHSHTRKYALRALLASALAACATHTPAPETTRSLLGAGLVPQELPAPHRGWLQLELDAALAAWEFQPTEMHAIWVGRRFGYLGRYTEAIDWYTEALSTYPDSYRLRRHLGHRFLTVRQLDAAVSTLSEARSLAAEHPNRLEPDGAPGPSGEPRSSTHGNIDYHLALAHYLRGEFTEAADLWMGCVNTWARSDDSRIAALHWLHVSLIRAGRAAQAEAVLDLVSETTDVIENFAYAELVQIYRGQLTVDSVLERELRSPGLEYGLARRLIATGDADRGEAMLRTLSDHASWPSFGVLAAEADLARSTSHD
ncbi:MAG: tetratricopeptide (TPR) repeat protein [Chlamydiales bacterium]|jgi:tetratricopeptide (TPR) repeat protein